VSLRWPAGAALAIVLASCDSSTAPDPVPGSPGWRETQVVRIQEAVYRRQFTDHAGGAQAGQVTFCLAEQAETDGATWTDPPDTLLRRFAGHAPAVKKVSLCHVDLRGDTDPATGKPAIVFYVGPPDWQKDSEVLVDGGHHRNGLDASGQTYRVQYQNGRWVVVEVTWRWIA
jgi:hypothetical protein